MEDRERKLLETSLIFVALWKPMRLYGTLLCVPLGKCLLLFTVSKFTQNNSLCLASYIVLQNMFLLSTYKVFSKFYCMGWYQEFLNTFEVLVQFSFNISVFFKKSQAFDSICKNSEGQLNWVPVCSYFRHREHEHHLMLFQCTQTRHRVDFATVLELDSKCVKIEKILWFIKHWHSTFINILK